MKFKRVVAITAWFEVCGGAQLLQFMVDVIYFISLQTVGFKDLFFRFTFTFSNLGMKLLIDLSGAITCSSGNLLLAVGSLHAQETIYCSQWAHYLLKWQYIARSEANILAQVTNYCSQRDYYLLKRPFMTRSEVITCSSNNLLFAVASLLAQETIFDLMFENFSNSNKKERKCWNTQKL